MTLTKYLSMAIALTLFLGCKPETVDVSPIVPPRTPTTESQKSHASFAHLATSPSQPKEVCWEIALTLAAISDAVYKDADALTAELMELGANAVTPVFESSNECVIASNDEAVVVAFRGTEDLADVLTDIKIFASRRTDERQHAGFYAGVDEIYETLLAEMRRHRTMDKKLWVTGHSLGGALAAVFAYRATMDDQIRPQGIMTFGQPLVFGGKAAQAVLDEFNIGYIRFVNSWDPITRCMPNYRHAGARVHLTRDGHSYRQPMISVKSTGENDAPGLVFIEDDPDLRPMSDEEFNTLEQQWNKGTPHSPPLLGSAEGGPIPVGASIPFYRRHQMVTYIEQIKREGQRKAPE